MSIVWWEGKIGIKINGRLLLLGHAEDCSRLVDGMLRNWTVY